MFRAAGTEWRGKDYDHRDLRGADQSRRGDSELLGLNWPAQQLLDVFGEDVALQIDARAGAVSAKRRMAERVWDDRRTQHAAFDRCHGQADAIDGDGALVHQVSVELVGDANAQPPVVIAEGIQAKELARAVHMALHDMAVHTAARGRRAFYG